MDVDRSFDTLRVSSTTPKRQDNGLKPDTLPISVCVGFGVTCDLAIAQCKCVFERATNLTRRMLDELADLDVWQVNGSRDEQIPHNLSVLFASVDAEFQLVSMPEPALVTGSASSAGSRKGSEALKAIGLPRDLAKGTVRISFGRNTTVTRCAWRWAALRSGEVAPEHRVSVSTASSGVAESGRPSKPGPHIFSGHESFACRYGWLPKLYEAAVDDPMLFSSDDVAILRLGLGRNMVKSLRFWGEAFGLTRTSGREVHVTRFAQMLLDPREGLDPYLETPGALWRLHWMLTIHAGLGAWAVAFLETYDREITRDVLLLP